MLCYVVRDEISTVTGSLHTVLCWNGRMFRSRATDEIRLRCKDTGTQQHTIKG
jgi:hypothetical protein